jgi:hypothetical protein
MVELNLMTLGFPKSEINEMSTQEIQILLQLISHMNRNQHGDEA